MNLTKPLVLCSTLNDPEGSLLLAIKKSASGIKENYADWIIVATEKTSKRVINELEKEGFHVIVDDSMRKLSADPIENTHLLALSEGLRFLKKDQRLQYTDGDWVVFGVAYYPDSLKETITKINKEFPESDYISLTRSFNDNQSHHSALVQTEACLTRAYQQILGAPIWYQPCFFPFRL